MSLASGIDLIETARVESAIQRYGERFLRRIYTPGELADCRANPASLAARFAAKEAVSKALGCGIGQVSWLEIEILRGEAGQPVLYLHGAAAQRSATQNLTHWSISLSHTQTLATAVAVAIG